MARAKEQPSSRLTVPAGAVAVLLVGGLACCLWYAQDFRRSGVIAARARIEGVPVGGLTSAQAKDRVQSQWVAALPKTFRLTGDGGRWDLERERLGLRLDLDRAVAQAVAIGRKGSIWKGAVTLLAAWRPGADLKVLIDVDGAVLRAALSDLAKRVDRRPEDASVRMNGGHVEVLPEKTGRELDIDASAATIASALKDFSSQEAKLSLRTAQPEVKAADLRDLNTQLSEYTTTFNLGKANRAHNIRLGVSLINGTAVLPGNVFSLNEALGPRAVSRGFKEAPTFVGGETVDTPGGGVCQIATTLYNAALLAGLDVTQRQHHSRPVPYCPAGRDAAISYGGSDLKFRNSFRHAVLILGSVSGDDLDISVIGSREDKVGVKLTRSGIETIPAGRKEIQDPTLPPGGKVVDQPARNGLRVTVTRTITRAGQPPEQETLHTDVYSPQDKVVRVGPPPPPKPGVVPVEPGKPGAPAPPAAKPLKPAKPMPKKKPDPARPAEKPHGD
jgi:vancomycin resistance protein YoaR